MCIDLLISVQRFTWITTYLHNDFISHTGNNFMEYNDLIFELILSTLKSQSLHVYPSDNHAFIMTERITAVHANDIFYFHVYTVNIFLEEQNGTSSLI